MKSHIQKSFFYVLLFGLLLNCKNDKTTTDQLPKMEDSAANGAHNAISIVTRSMEFQMVDTISSGWNTFKYDNLSNETHFFRFVKLPEHITIATYKKDIDPIFEEGMDLINAGKPTEGFKAFDKLPKWFSECVPSGGSGLIAPKHEAVTTFSLHPGNYIIECYVKMPNGKFHSTMGMVKQVIVTENKSAAEPPIPTNTIEIKEDGFHVGGNLQKGAHTFEVHVINQKLHENFATSDVHLVKLATNANIDALEAWMVWYDAKGFITPVPDGVTFLGGFNDATQGSKGYFYANLDPGNYAFIAEVPNAREKGLLKEFEVKD